MGRSLPRRCVRSLALAGSQVCSATYLPCRRKFSEPAGSCVSPTLHAAIPLKSVANWLSAARLAKMENFVGQDRRRCLWQIAFERMHHAAKDEVLGLLLA